jgi:staphyloferrin B synthase
MALSHTPPKVADAILTELFDALWIEDVAGFRSRAALGTGAPDGGRDYALSIGAGHLRARLVPDGWRDGMRLASAVHYETATARDALDAAGLLEHVLSGEAVSRGPNPAAQAGARTLEHLRALLDRADLWDALAPGLEADVRAGAPIALERLAAWGDRPFHPLARVRHGLSRAESEAYGAETGRFFALAWYAVARSRLVGAPRSDSDGPAAALLTPAQRAVLEAELAARGCAASHIAVPVHPWQDAHVVRPRFAAEIADGEIVALQFQGPLVTATSSLRTLVLPGQPGLHLKLPLDVQTLGVRRLLPPQSLQNGLHGARLLADGIAQESWLTAHVALADESAFWHFNERDGDLYAERAALLGCALRRLPGLPGTLVPLASFAVAPMGGLPPAVRAVAGDDPDLPALFGAIADLVLGTALRCACLGFVPELHGQNALLACDDGLPRRIVLRDHDTVRCAPGWLGPVGLAVPAYLITDPQRNSLLLRRPEDLLAYAQTLALDVALRAVAEAFAACGLGFSFAEARAILIVSARTALAEAEAPAAHRAAIGEILLRTPTAPFKQVLTPLLATGRLGTSMPSQLGIASNPLWRGTAS